MHECKNCGAELVYQSEVAAPGSGQDWQCPECGIGYCVRGNSIIEWEDIDYMDNDYSHLEM